MSKLAAENFETAGHGSGRSTKPPSLSVPITGQALRASVASHHAQALMDYARSLRVAGYKVDSGRLADELLRNGCANVEDAFGQRVALHVSVPRPDAPPKVIEERQEFHLAV